MEEFHKATLRVFNKLCCDFSKNCLHHIMCSSIHVFMQSLEASILQFQNTFQQVCKQIADNDNKMNSLNNSTNVCTVQDFIEHLSSSKQVKISENFAYKLPRIRPGFYHVLRQSYSRYGTDLQLEEIIMQFFRSIV